VPELLPAPRHLLATLKENNVRLQLFQQSAFVVWGSGDRGVAFDLGYEVSSTVVSGLVVEAVVISHKHPDHLHREHLEALSVPVFGPPDVVKALTDLAAPVNVIRPGDVIQVAGMTISAFAVDHGPNLSAEIDNLGLLIEDGRRRVLFLGDMAAPSKVPAGPWDLMLIPVGASKVFTVEAARDFVEQVGHAGKVAPIHFHGRSDLTCGERFRTLAAPICDACLINVGETVEV
jgi:L-ascorbate metabolism protein UlaG (beta-lactamase superfamily)